MTRPHPTGNPRDPSEALGLHLLRNPRCARFLKRIKGLDHRLVKLADLAVATPRLIQTQGFPRTAYMLASRQVFEYAAWLDMVSQTSRADLPTIRECLDGAVLPENFE